MANNYKGCGTTEQRVALFEAYLSLVGYFEGIPAVSKVRFLEEFMYNTYRSSCTVTSGFGNWVKVNGYDYEIHG